MITYKDFFDIDGLVYADIFAQNEPVWTALDGLDKYLENQIPAERPLSGVKGFIDTNLFLHNGQVREGLTIKNSGPKGSVQVFDNDVLLEGVSVIMAGAYLADDIISLGAGVVVESGAFVKGPVLVGDGATIRQGAYIRGNCLIGASCVVGHTTEMKNSIMLDGAQAGHFAYIGDSILGRNVNLGAGTKLANLKIIPGTVKVRAGKDRYDTGRRKLGAVLGDGTQTGCNSVTSPGSLLGPGSIVYPGVVVPSGYHPRNTMVRSGKNSVKIHSGSETR